MAKKSKQKKKANKSALIKSALTEDPNASPKALAEALNKQGLKVTPGYVSTIKSNFLKGKSGGRTRNGRGRGKDETVSMSQLKQLKKLVDDIGSVDRTRKLLGILDELR